MRTLLLVAALTATTVAGSPHASPPRQAPLPRPATCSVRLPDSAASPVTRVPIEISNNHVFLTVCAGDRALDFLLDTGASQSPFDLGIATSLGAERKNPHRVSGAGAGTTAGASIAPQRVTIAGTSITLDVSSAVDFQALTPREGRRIEGIIGADFIRRFIVAIDYVNGELGLHDRQAFQYVGRGVTVPLYFENGKPMIDAAIRLSDGDVAKGRFVVDVGSALAVALTKPFVEQHRLRERVGPVIQRPSGGGVGGPADATIGRVPVLTIGGLELKAPVTHMFGDRAGVFSGNPNWIGNIGADILRRFTVYFDYEGKRMILEPNARIGEPFEADMSGATYIAHDPGELLVDYVLPGSAAAEAGLERGDVITAVDDRGVDSRSLLELRFRLRREDESVTLSVVRAGVPRTVTFRTRRII